MCSGWLSTTIETIEAGGGGGRVLIKTRRSCISNNRGGDNIYQ